MGERLTVAGANLPASPAEWQGYALALRSYVQEGQGVIEDLHKLYADVGMVRRLVDGEQRLFGSSSDDQLDMDDLESLLSGSSIGPPHGLDLLTPITKPWCWFPTRPSRPLGTCPDQIDLRGGLDEEIEREFRELSLRLDDYIASTNEQLMSLQRGIAVTDPVAIRRLMSVSHVRHKLPACLAQAFDVDLDFSARVALCTVEIPDFASFRIFGRRNAAASAKEGRRVLETMLYSLCLRAAHLVASSDVGDWFDTVAVNARQSWRDRATGAPCDGIIASLQTGKNEILGLHLDQVDPKACFRHLKGISTPSLEQVAPVRPIFILNKADNRIIEDKNVARGMEPEANLAAMPWEDFEHLVRQLFEWEFGQHGVEVKVTRASRDRGVDAIMFDPDPLRGGKYVLQAKRYTRPVDVAAVRDLYGTVVNEGANRGILVTTSSYGPDSYDFAKNKPISLVDGPNLIAMLKRHGRGFRIDLAEARRLDAEGKAM
jgi:restriction system protein